MFDAVIHGMPVEDALEHYMQVRMKEVEDSGGEIESVKTGQRVAIGGRDFRIRPEDGAIEAQTGQTQFMRERDDSGAAFGREVAGLAEFYRSVWALGPAGVDVPLTLDREGDVFEVSLNSRDRRSFLKSARYH